MLSSIAAGGASVAKVSGVRRDFLFLTLDRSPCSSVPSLAQTIAFCDAVLEGGFSDTEI